MSDDEVTHTVDGDARRACHEVMRDSMEGVFPVHVILASMMDFICVAVHSEGLDLEHFIGELRAHDAAGRE